LSSAYAPAMCGAAMEVPLKKANPPPGTEELMLSPGASSDKNEAELENEERVSDFVVEPTLTALDMHAGAPRASVKSSLPEEITVAMPADLRLSIIALRESESQLVVKRPPPRLKHLIWIPIVPRVRAF
jgi:hypothetical protein